MTNRGSFLIDDGRRGILVNGSPKGGGLLLGWERLSGKWGEIYVIPLD